jgi:GTP-binding protein
MLPVIALVGRPNVGKSTLFNRLTRSRDALVADQPGITRDRKHGVGKIGAHPYVIVDTGGISGEADGIDVLMEKQVKHAIGEADHLIFLLDGRDGMTGADEAIAEELRKTGKPITVAVNKSEGLDKAVAGADFYALGLGDPHLIAAAHGGGVKHLINTLLDTFIWPDKKDEEEEVEEEDKGIQIALVGRPNVGKSTLVNRLLGEDRVVAFDRPGTTRDSIAIPFEQNGKQYTLIDTAGVRRRARIAEAIEKFSVIKTLQAMEQANVVMLILDAHLCINKWDGLDSHERDQIKSEMLRRLPFLAFAEWRFISALHGSGVGHLMEAVDQAYNAAMIDMKTPELTRILEEAVQEHQPPMARGRRIKLRYAHQGGKNPPIIVIHGNLTDAVPPTYQRYLMNRFRECFDLHGTPLRIEFKGGENPFEGRKNTLTKRQVDKRRRMMKHVKKR